MIDEKLDFEELIVNGSISKIKIGSHKDDLDNLFGKEFYGDLNEALYLKNNLQCYFDTQDKLEKFKLKIGVGDFPFLENIFSNIIAFAYLSEYDFAELWEEKGFRFLTFKPFFFEGTKTQAGIISNKNVSLVFDYENKGRKLKKDRILLDSVWVDNGFSWAYELYELSNDKTPEASSKIHDKFFGDSPFKYKR